VADDITRFAPQKWFHDSQLVHDARRICPGTHNGIGSIADEILQCRITVVLTYFYITLCQGLSEGSQRVRGMRREAVVEDMRDAERVKAMERRI
jgi:hypothetical protein